MYLEINILLDMKGFQLARDRGMLRLPQAVWDFYKDT